MKQMIDKETVARIIDTARIEEVVGDFVTLRRRGSNLIGLCPFHDEKTPSFIVSPAKGIYKCFGCGKAGGAVNFVMEHEQLDYPDALRYLARKYRIEIREEEMSEEQVRQRDDRESMFALNVWTQRYFERMLWDDEQGRAIGLGYFRSRGFTDETVRKFGLGYCLDQRDGVFREAQRAGFKAEYIEKCGLCARGGDGSWYDRFRGRVMFPVHTLSGKVVAFGGRVLRKSDRTAKYVNSPESEVYHKSSELYGIYFAKQSIVKYDRCFLVEGYTDVISMHQSGVQNVVASSGTSLTQGQIKMIHRFTPNVTLLYDGDGAGIRAAVRGVDMLLAEGMNVKVVLLPDGEDPDSYAQGHNADEFVRFIDENQVDFIRFKINLLMSDAGDDPIKRAELISDVVGSISVIPDKIVQSVYCRECSALLDIEEGVIVGELRKRLYERRESQLRERGRGVRGAADVSGSSGVVGPLTEVVAGAVRSEGGQAEMAEMRMRGESPLRRYEDTLLGYAVYYGGDVLYEDTTVNEFIVGTIEDFKAQLCEEYGEEVDEVFRGDRETLFAGSEVHKRFSRLLQGGDRELLCAKFYVNNADPGIAEIGARKVEMFDDMERVELAYRVPREKDREPDPEIVEKCRRDHRTKMLTIKLGEDLNAYMSVIIKMIDISLQRKIEAAAGGGGEGLAELLRRKTSLCRIKPRMRHQNGSGALDVRI